MTRTFTGSPVAQAPSSPNLGTGPIESGYSLDRPMVRGLECRRWAPGNSGSQLLPELGGLHPVGHVPIQGHRGRNKAVFVVSRTGFVMHTPDWGHSLACGKSHGYLLRVFKLIASQDMLTLHLQQS